MLRPLLLLWALSWLRVDADFIKTEELDQCPIKFYGKEYTHLYLSSTTEQFAMCFTGHYNTQSNQDCIVAPPLTTDSVLVSNFGFALSTFEKNLRDNVESIPSDASCTCQTSFRTNTVSEFILSFCQFGTQTALRIVTPTEGEIQFIVSDVVVDRVNIKFSQGSDNALEYRDISGCRQGGKMYKPDTEIRWNKNNCTVETCDSTANVLSISCVEPLERCQSSGICILDPVCSVIGPSVINFRDEVINIPDRCTYSLIEGSPFSGVKVLGKFLERRRKDVYFLDSVILHLEWSDSKIYLEQGGRVRLNNKLLTLNSLAQTFEDVQLSKTQAGVTASVSKNNYTMTVFFDDYTVQISLTGPTGNELALMGLCNNTGSIDDSRHLDFGPANCDKQYDDTNESSSFFLEADSYCGLLNDAPFTACHSYVDQEPYIEACKKTLCSYPAVDSLDCQFVEAYDRVCSQRMNDTLEDWRPSASCSTPKAFCEERICSDHEFCAATISGEISCFCRAIFAAPYRSDDAFGEPMVCDQTSASVTLVGCLLEEKGIGYSALQLNDEDCKGQIDEKDHKVTFTFTSSNTCGTVVTNNNNHVIFENTIMIKNDFIINRQIPVHINFSCVYSLPEDQTMGLRIRDNSVVKQITSGAWNYTLTMKAYTNELLTEVVDTNVKVDLNQKIWVELYADGLDGSFVTLVMDSCWATDKESPNGSPRHDLFKNSCADTADQTVKVYRNGLGASNYFSFNMFEFTGSSGDVYLHCKVNLCVKHGGSCVPNCNRGGRRRRSPRSQYMDEASGFITLVWTQ